MNLQNFIPTLTEPSKRKWKDDFGSIESLGNIYVLCQMAIQDEKAEITQQYDTEAQTRVREEIVQNPFSLYVRITLSYTRKFSFADLEKYSWDFILNDQTNNVMTEFHYCDIWVDTSPTTQQPNFMALNPMMSYSIQETDSFGVGGVDTSEAGSDIPTELQLDEETIKMCKQNGLLTYMKKLDAEIYKTYKNVIMIKHRVLDYGDIPKQERLRFEIHLTGEPKEILRDEKKLYAFLFSQIPDEKQDFFSFTYRIS